MTAAPMTAAPMPTPGPPRVVVLDWKLRLESHGAWTTPPPSLHAFSVGRWECALGAVQLEASQQTRKLACTHASGATLQTKLSCQAERERPRELELSLDTAPPMQLRCEPQP
ncbi:MAG: hypothetical protein JWN48_2177 [Myxococcaceae bacterium]|nr:hypothetical protein [Myxococcaceae bacterium]